MGALAFGGSGGPGGAATGDDAGKTTITNNAGVTTSGNTANGLHGENQGGTAIGGFGGGDGGLSGLAFGGDGGDGGDGGLTLPVALAGNATGNANGGAGAIAFGGFGGDGGGATGGNGGLLTITNSTLGGNVTTFGDDSDAIHADAAGGAVVGGFGGAGGGGGGGTGGAGGVALPIAGGTGNASGDANGGAGGLGFGGFGGNGALATGGDSGPVVITTISGNLATSGVDSDGIHADSFGGTAVGGFGGAGGIGIGGAGGDAGNATPTGGATGAADGSATGGAGASAFGGFGGAGAGANGGDSGTVDIVNGGGITTLGNLSDGVSVTASGGTGFGGFGNVGGIGFGGNGGAGGISSPVSGAGGANADGEANGGAGGAGFGGFGGPGAVGNGGDAGNVGLINNGVVNTAGADADGLTVTSSGGAGFGGSGGIGGPGLGGDGGLGGVSLPAASGTATGDANGGAGGAGFGGFGGAGGAGNGGNSGKVTVTNNNAVATTGAGSDAIFVASAGGAGFGGLGGAGGAGVGGSGGAGGVSVPGGAVASIGDANGGSGGAGFGGFGGAGAEGRGGDSGDIMVTNNALLITSGAAAHGIFATSSGGAGFGGTGGDGGAGAGGDGADGGTATAGTANGGDGGAGFGGFGGAGSSGFGGDSGDINVVNNGAVLALNFGSNGIFAITNAGVGFGGLGGAGGAGLGGAGGAGGIGVGGPALPGVPGVGFPGAPGAAGLGTDGLAGSIDIRNAGLVVAGNDGVNAQTNGAAGTVLFTNSGFTVGGTGAGVRSFSQTDTDIVNLSTGFITATSLRAIDIKGASGEILNAGVVLGFVDLTDQGDTFTNQSGGVFEARLTSDFRGGVDLFDNLSGATVHTAANIAVQENVFFVNLETFRTAGAISLQDGMEGDRFTLANTLGGTNLAFVALPGSSLAVDSFLGGPGSISDVLRVDGNVTGSQTVVDVFNTSFLPGTFNDQGITVAEVRGAVDKNAFALRNGPIDTGFFDYDLFFEPAGVDPAHDPFNEFELRSFLGAGAFILPQLITAAQDIAFNTSSSWFDRTADLRVIINNGGGFGVTTTQPAMLAGGGMKDDGYSERPGLSAVWARGSIGTLDRDGDASTKAFGKTFDFNLDRDLLIADFVTGHDFGIRDVMTPGDAFIFGVLSGWVHADLDFDQVDRRFDYDGYELGVYGTYISGGLFVDGLLQAQFLDLETDALGFRRDDLDVDTYTGRLEAGYRYGFSGMFFEPLATIAVAWADVEDFSFAGNAVDFDDDAAVRGRLGLRVGTSYTLWDAIRVEPFVIGSVWGRFTDDNNATLVSTNTAFALSDNNDDVWGEVSIGSNYFNMSKRVSAFSKTDIQFGDDLSGVTTRFGLKYIW